MAAHMAVVTVSMRDEYLFNADGEMLIVAQEGRLRFRTEFGVIEIEPGEICVIQRGVIFRVETQKIRRRLARTRAAGAR